jgi:hypothetical protein
LDYYLETPKIMKRLSLAVILFLTVLGTTHANPISPKDGLHFVGADDFLRHFPQATSINYKVTNQFTEVNFEWNGLQLQAFYDRDGNPLATTRAIDRSSLPVNAMLTVKKFYPDGVITSAIEYSGAGEDLSYYVTVAAPKTTYLLHVSTSGDCSVFKKMYEKSPRREK